MPSSLVPPLSFTVGQQPTGPSERDPQVWVARLALAVVSAVATAVVLKAVMPDRR